MKGRQNAWGSTGCPWPSILSQVWAPSSTCFLQRSKSCWLGMSTMMRPLRTAVRARPRPSASNGPRRPAPRSARCARRQLHVLPVPAAHGLDQWLHATGRRDIVFLRANRQHRAVDALEPHRAPGHRELPLDQLVLLVEVLDPLAEELAREREVLVGPLVQRVEAGDIVR